MEQLETLKQWITESRRIVFFGGAGVSTVIRQLVHRSGISLSVA